MGVLDMSPPPTLTIGNATLWGCVCHGKTPLKYVKMKAFDASSGGGSSRSVNEFPSFLPKEVKRIKDPFARKLAQRIERLPVQVICRWSRIAPSIIGFRASWNATTGSPLGKEIGSSNMCIMSSCVKPTILNEGSPVVLLHCFDSSCLEWRCAFPLLEEEGLEAWAVDVLGWGFSDLEKLPSCSISSKRDHLYQLWKSHIKKPITLVGPSLGAAAAIDFAVNHSKAVEKLILINPCVYAEGVGVLAKLPRMLAYAGVSLLKSIPLRLYANIKAFYGASLATTYDWTHVGRLHCLMPWWEDATISFMLSGGYNVVDLIKEVKQKVLIIHGEQDRIVSKKLSVRLHCELQDAIWRQVSDCGHLPHVEEPTIVAKLIADFARHGYC